ncbi:MAG: hypothetical protein AB7O52_08965 [Planctomycetota bacterium]
MKNSDRSVMVVLDREEYCFLYDRESFPELLEAILDHDEDPANSPPGFLHRDHAREIARGLLGQLHQSL